jgi:hypothetical protein
VVVVGTVTVGGGADGPDAAETVIVKIAVPVPWLLVAPIVTLVDPAAVGVPLIVPVAASRERPFGKGVAL